jgi:hypothetical protein
VTTLALSPRALRGKVLAVLVSEGIPTNPRLPLLDRRSKHGLRKPSAVAERLVILYALTGLANEADAELLRQWLLENGLYEELLPSERPFFEKPLSRQDEIDLSWRQEALVTLAWSGRLVEDLPLPFDESDLDPIFPRIPPEVEVSSFVTGFALRHEEDLYHQTDLHYCLHWALRHPEVWDASTVRRPRIDSVIERRHALEWLIGAADSWDDVPLDT